MNITVEKMKELPDGSAICTLDMDKEAIQYLVGEGFLAVIKRALETSESAIKPEMLAESKDVEL
jgi:hypothetical protein